MGLGRWEGGRRLANFKGPPGLRRGERSLICSHLFSLSRRWKSDPYLRLPRARRAPPGPPLPSPGAWPTPGQARGGGGRTLHAGRARSVPVWESPSAWRTKLASPHLPAPRSEDLGLGGRRGCAHSHHSCGEPTFPRYLPDLVFPNTQFIFLSGAASFLFSAAFRGQGSSDSPQ